MPPSTTDTLLAELRRLKLVTDEAAARAEAAVRTSPPDQLPRVLTEAGLTRFQARAVLAGQASRLVFGPYVLLDKIGEGGMGVVYKARHARLGRIDAVKVLRADKIASRTIAKRFLREIQFTSRLEHPHVVRAHDAGVVRRQLYLATEYVNGTDLGTLVQTRGPRSVADACLVIYQAALALKHIHEKGMVHRDLKPSNLIRDEATGAVKILDLGLSGFNRAVEEHGSWAKLTRDGVVLGTPDFMAPEQVQDAHAVDIRADLYSLGCTFFFLLTGRPPYEGTPVEKMYRHGFSPPPVLVLPSGLRPPAGLAEILARLMAKRPDERFQTPQEVIDALLAIRPGSNSDTGTTLGHTVATQTPAPSDSISDGAFAHLLSNDSVNRRESAREAGSVRLSLWVLVLALAALFSVGFMTAGMYFKGGR
jgi:serine/threonine-protein kinase